MIRNGITILGITGNKQGNSAGEWAKKGANMTDQAFFSPGGATNFNFDNVNMAQTENPSVWVDGVTVEEGDAGEGDGGDWANDVSTWANIAGIFVSAAQGTIQNSQLGSNITYAISGNRVLLNSVTNGFKYAPYVGLTMTVGTGYYLSTHINPTTNQHYQSWAETGIDIGANIGTIYLASQYGGWVGAVAATIYIVDKAAFNAYMNTVREHPDWVLPPSVHSLTH